MIKVKSVSHLKTLAGEEGGDFVLLLNGGIRSSKFIAYNAGTDKFSVTNMVDDSEQELTENQLFTDSNIGEAIVNSALVFEE